MAVVGQGITSKLVAGAGVITAGAAAVNTAKNLAGAISAGGAGGNVIGAIRAIDLPAAGEAVGDLYSAVANFVDGSNENDWRVRLSLPSWPSFATSVVLKPLKDAGGMIFPYTPTINITSNAKYSPIDTTHTNYTFQAFKNSDPGLITITAPMNVEDPTQGLYWIAAVHYLRSLTKMFVGIDPKAGNPPPIVHLNGYGNYVFKNVPVVVTSFSTSLDANCDYISVPVVGSAAGIAEGLADAVGGLSDSLGSAFPAAAAVTGPLSTIAGGVGQVAALAGLFGVGGSTSGGTTHVPTKSSFTVTLQPIYSRASARNFSLDRFVEGGYLSNQTGYI
jgi:hypothetical protein